MGIDLLQFKAWSLGYQLGTSSLNIWVKAGLTVTNVVIINEIKLKESYLHGHSVTYRHISGIIDTCNLYGIKETETGDSVTNLVSKRLSLNIGTYFELVL